jgi:hypothetical protein
MAQFSHVIELTKEEVEQAVLELALKKAAPRGLSLDSFSVHTRASVVLATVAGSTPDNMHVSARISWKDE